MLPVASEPEKSRGRTLKTVSRHSSLRKIMILVAVRTKASVCSLSTAGIAGSNPAEGKDVCLLELLYVVR